MVYRLMPSVRDWFAESNLRLGLLAGALFGGLELVRALVPGDGLVGLVGAAVAGVVFGVAMGCFFRRASRDLAHLPQQDRAVIRRAVRRGEAPGDPRPGHGHHPASATGPRAVEATMALGCTWRVRRARLPDRRHRRDHWYCSPWRCSSPGLLAVLPAAVARDVRPRHTPGGRRRAGVQADGRRTWRGGLNRRAAGVRHGN